MFAAKSSAWHVPFTPTYLCKLQYFSCGRDTEKRLITIALVESAIPAKIHGGDPRNICPVVARLRFHFPSSPRPTSFFLFFSSSFSFLFFLFHFSRGLLLFHGEIGRCSFIDSLQIHRFVVRLWMDNDSYFSLFLFFFFPSYFQRVGHFYNFLSPSPSNIFVVLATLFLRTFVFISRIQICYSDFIFFLENQRFEFMDLWIFSSI